MKPLLISTFNNIYWTNYSRLKPCSVLSLAHFKEYTEPLIFVTSTGEKKKKSVDIKPNYYATEFNAFIKLKGKELYTYAFYDGYYWFLERRQKYGPNLYLYEMVYDFWCNDVLTEGFRIKGIQSATSKGSLILENIHTTKKLLTTYNQRKYVNVRTVKDEPLDVVKVFNPFPRFFKVVNKKQYNRILSAYKLNAKRKPKDTDPLILSLLRWKDKNNEKYTLTNEIIKNLMGVKTFKVYNFDTEKNSQIVGTLFDKYNPPKLGEEDKDIRLRVITAHEVASSRVYAKTEDGASGVKSFDISGLTDIVPINRLTLNPEPKKFEPLEIDEEENDTTAASLKVYKLENLPPYKVGQILEYEEKFKDGVALYDSYEIITGIKEGDPDPNDKNSYNTQLKRCRKGDIVIPLATHTLYENGTKTDPVKDYFIGKRLEHKEYTRGPIGSDLREIDTLAVVKDQKNFNLGCLYLETIETQTENVRLLKINQINPQTIQALDAREPEERIKKGTNEHFNSFAYMLETVSKKMAETCENFEEKADLSLNFAPNLLIEINYMLGDLLNKKGISFADWWNKTEQERAQIEGEISPVPLAFFLFPPEIAEKTKVSDAQNRYAGHNLNDLLAIYDPTTESLKLWKDNNYGIWKEAYNYDEFSELMQLFANSWTDPNYVTKNFYTSKIKNLHISGRYYLFIYLTKIHKGLPFTLMLRINVNFNYGKLNDHRAALFSSLGFVDINLFSRVYKNMPIKYKNQLKGFGFDWAGIEKGYERYDIYYVPTPSDVYRIGFALRRATRLNIPPMWSEDYGRTDFWARWGHTTGGFKNYKLNPITPEYLDYIDTDPENKKQLWTNEQDFNPSDTETINDPLPVPSEELWRRLKKYNEDGGLKIRREVKQKTTISPSVETVGDIGARLLRAFTYEDVESLGLDKIGQGGQLFDLVGTNFLAFARKVGEGWDFEYILKDPEESLDNVIRQKYEAKNPLYGGNVHLIKAINHNITLVAYGEHIPLNHRLDPRKEFIDFDEFNIEGIKQLTPSSIFNLYKLNLRSKFDFIDTVIREEAAPAVIKKDMSAYEYESLKLEFENNKNMRRFESRDLLFSQDHQIEQMKNRLRNLEYEETAGWWSGVVGNVLGGIGSMAMGVGAIASGNLLAGVMAGSSAISGIGSGIKGLFDLDHKTKQARAEYETDKKYQDKKFALERDRMQHTHEYSENMEKMRLINLANTSSVSTGSTTLETRAINKKLNRADIYLMIDWLDEESIQYKALTDYYNNYGYEVFIHDNEITSEDIKIGGIFKFALVDFISVPNPIIKTELTTIFTSGVKVMCIPHEEYDTPGERLPIPSEPAGPSELETLRAKLGQLEGEKMELMREVEILKDELEHEDEKGDDKRKRIKELNDQLQQAKEVITKVRENYAHKAEELQKILRERNKLAEDKRALEDELKGKPVRPTPQDNQELEALKGCLKKSQEKYELTYSYFLTTSRVFWRVLRFIDVLCAELDTVIKEMSDNTWSNTKSWNWTLYMINNHLTDLFKDILKPRKSNVARAREHYFLFDDENLNTDLNVFLRWYFKADNIQEVEIYSWRMKKETRKTEDFWEFQEYLTEKEGDSFPAFPRFADRLGANYPGYKSNKFTGRFEKTGEAKHSIIRWDIATPEEFKALCGDLGKEKDENKEIQKLKESVDTLQNLLKIKDNQLKTKTNEMEEVKKQLKTCQDNLAAEQAKPADNQEANALREQINTLQNQLNTRTQELNAKTNELGAKVNELNAKTAELTEKTNELEESKRNLTICRNNLERVEAANRENEQKATQNQNLANLYLAEKNQLQRNLQQVTQQRDQARSQYNNCVWHLTANPVTAANIAADRLLYGAAGVGRNWADVVKYMHEIKRLELTLIQNKNANQVPHGRTVRWIGDNLNNLADSLVRVMRPYIGASESHYAYGSKIPAVTLQTIRDQ